MITQERLKELLHYDPETGIFTWLIKPKSSRRKIGDEAGNYGMDGYINITVNSKSHPAHRLAWLYVYGEHPKQLIDHIDGDTHNNKISNLREASHYQNRLNSKTSINNKCGLKGVSFKKSRNKWIAQCSYNKKQYILGLFDTAEEAHEEYKKFAKIHHGEFYREPSQPTTSQAESDHLRSSL